MCTSLMRGIFHFTFVAVRNYLHMLPSQLLLVRGTLIYLFKGTSLMAGGSFFNFMHVQTILEIIMAQKRILIALDVDALGGFLWE